MHVDVGTVALFEFNESRVLPASSADSLKLTGQVRVSASGNTGRCYVLVLDGELASLEPQTIARSIRAIKEVPVKGGAFEIELAQTGLKPGDDLSLLGLLDRDAAAQGFPRLSPNDLFGLYIGSEGFHRKLIPGENRGFDVSIDRQIYDGQTTVSGRVLGATGGTDLLIAAYTGNLESLTSFELDYNKVMGIAQIAGGNDNRYELPVTPIGQPFPVSAYIVAVADANQNQKLDPGEAVYFHSSRSDKVPEKVTLSQGQGSVVDLNLKFTTQIPRGYAMPLTGRIDWQAVDARSAEPAYLFVAKGDSVDAITQSPLTSLKYLSRLQGRPSSYEITLEDTDLAPGDKVMIGVFLDKDASMSLTPGDRLGIAGLSLSGFTQSLSSGGRGGLDIPVIFSLYDTQKSVDVIINAPGLANYSGRLISLIYNGALNSLDPTSFDPTKVVGYVDFTKAATKSSFAVPILPVANLPLSDVSLITLFDANANGSADPGESVGFYAAKVGGMPKPFSITAASSDTLYVNSSIVVPVPSGFDMSLNVKLESVFGVDASVNPVSVAVVLEAPLDLMVRDPLRYIKSFLVVSDLSKPVVIDLKSTDLRPGDRVTLLAFNRAPGSSSPNGQLLEGAQVGSLFRAASFDTVYPLNAGVNDVNAAGFTMQIDRVFYEHDGSIAVKIDGGSLLRNGDTLTWAAYQVDPNNVASLSSIDYSKVIAFGKSAYNGAATFTLPILPALAQGLVDPTTRKISNILVAAFRDDNGNGKYDSSEPAAFYSESGGVLPSLKTISLTQNPLTGTLLFNGAVTGLGNLLQQLPLGLGH